MGKEFLTIYWREMIRFTRFKGQLFAALVQPALWLLLFGVAMSSNFDAASGAFSPLPGVVSIDYLTFMAAGVMAMTALFTCLFGGMGLLFDKNWGIMKEMLASPMRNHHIQIGVGLGGITKALIQVGLIMVFGLVLGVTFFSGFSAIETVMAVLGIFAFIAVFSAGFIFLSAGLAMRVESMESIQAMMTLLTLPLMFSSNALYSTSAFPGWLQAVSTVNPLTYLVNGIRYFALGDDFTAMGTHYEYTGGDIILSFIVLLAFTGLTFVFAWRAFKTAKVT
ncbi:MAG: ABC transporter permease [Candidatus Thermoplasmatota archaeon]|nr:ABC transporter permease [Candidatus Thermoplasmatota archaeon]